MKAAIVIPSHKRIELLYESIESIRKVDATIPIIVVHTYAPEAIRVMNHVTYIKQNLSKVGPAAAVNQGFELAIQSKYDIVFRIDDDVRIHKSKYNIIATMISALSNNAQIGIVSAWNRSLAWRQRGQDKMARMTNPAQCVAFRVSALKEVGLFDESFLTREDTELTIRHFIAGWECAVVSPEVTFDHVAPAYTAESTFSEAREKGVEVRSCDQLGTKYHFVNVSKHPKKEELRRVSYLPGLKKLGVVSKEFIWNEYELVPNGNLEVKS